MMKTMIAIEVINDGNGDNEISKMIMMIATAMIKIMYTRGSYLTP